jgi:hypothetical protein
MATANSKPNAAAFETTQLTELAEKAREQLVSTVKQGQKLTVDAAQAWTKAAAALPTPDLPKIPGVNALPSAEAMTTYTFDLAIELLNAQRDFALQLAGTFAPVNAV